MITPGYAELPGLSTAGLMSMKPADQAIPNVKQLRLNVIAKLRVVFELLSSSPKNLHPRHCKQPGNHRLDDACVVPSSEMSMINRR